MPLPWAFWAAYRKTRAAGIKARLSRCDGRMGIRFSAQRFDAATRRCGCVTVCNFVAIGFRRLTLLGALAKSLKAQRLLSSAPDEVVAGLYG
jgi:hypothetical protein